MNWKQSTAYTLVQRGALLVLAPLMMALTCEGEPDLQEIEEYTETPLIQESVIPVEFLIDGFGWVPMLVPQATMERFARAMCWFRRAIDDGEELATEDRRLCGAAAVPSLQTELEDFEFFTGEFDPARLEAGGLTECQEQLCWARNQLCAGMWLDEIARSPLPQELEFNDFDISMMVPTHIREAALHAVGADPDITSTTGLRFQPLQAPGRAAALRGALNSFRQAGVAAHAMQDAWVFDPAQGTASTCLQHFDEEPSPFLTYENPDPNTLSMNDVYFLLAADSANQYMKTLERTVAAMKDSAESQVAGKYDPLKETATLWNGKVDSALAIAKLIGWGESDAPGGQQMMTGSISCAEKLTANTVGPAGLPVCPPTANEQAVQIAREILATFEVKPDPLENRLGIEQGIPQKLATAYNNKTGENLTAEEFLKKFGITQEDLAKAAFQQCKQAELTMMPFTPKEEVTSGVWIDYGTAPPSSQNTLGKSALAIHFTGTAQNDTSAKLGGALAGNYAKQGGLRFLDLIGTTQKKLASSPEASGVNSKAKAALDEAALAIKGLVGKHRLEFHIGEEQNGVEVNRVRITIHGVAHSQGTPIEKFYLVQGVPGLLCATKGNINSAPCVLDDYLMDFNAMATFTATPDSRMIDLDGGWLTADITSVKRKECDTAVPPNCTSTGPILQEEGLYIIREEGGARIAHGGVVPTVGTLGVLPAPSAPTEDTWPSWDVTRQVIAPVGGTLEDVLANAITPNSADCSKLQNTCAGVPVDIWPPLESELVGDGSVSGQPAEQSWRYWLSLARAAAAEADLRGQELLEHGLRMDLRIEEHQKELDVICGGGLEGCGFGPGGEPAELQRATLGDRDVCIWKVNGVACERSANAIGEGVPCPLPLDGDAVEQTCETEILKWIDSGQTTNMTYEIVKTRLGLVQTSGLPPSGGDCDGFKALRADSHNELKSGSEKMSSRSEFIRKYIAKEFTQARVAQIAAALSYEEEFADNYILRYGQDKVIFDTRRPSPHATADKAIAPCNPSDADRATGSDYWSRKGDALKCFAASGDNPGPCTGDVGEETCLTPDISSRSVISQDTEHNALRRRWAWGFGHLRRAATTLGLMTGQLDGNLKLATVYGVAYRGVLGEISENPWGRSCNTLADVEAQDEARWVAHCRPNKKDDYKPIARCVPANNIPGNGNDVGRVFTGRPVNQNAFIPNSLSHLVALNFIDGGAAGADTTGKWPIVCNGTGTGACAFGGVDPQMPYCSLPFWDDIPDAEDLQNMAAADVWDEIMDIQTTWKHEGLSSGYVGAGIARAAAVRSIENSTAWKNAVDEMWTVPEGDFCANDKTSELKGAIWRALCFAPAESGEVDDPNDSASWAKEQLMKFGRISSKGQLRVEDTKIRTWVSPVPASEAGWHGQMLFDLRKGSARAGNAPFQYELNDRNIFDAFELACHASARAAITVSVPCNDIDIETGNATERMGRIQGALDCLADAAARAGEAFVVQAPKALIDKVSTSQALGPSAGLGGEFLDTVNRQYIALKRVGGDYQKVRDANAQLALAVQTLREIDEEDTNSDKAASALKMAELYKGMASATQALGSASLWGAAAGAQSAAFAITGSMYQIKAINFQSNAANAAFNQKRLDVIARMLKELSAARDAADDLVLALNDLNKATTDLGLLQKKASKAWAGINFSDYVSDDKKDPQYVNVAMRRMFNTQMIRYDEALTRAKKLAYLARRAVELRFGVDLQRMTSDMTLVKAPSTWASDVCNVTGINYAEIRQPNPEQPIKEWNFGDSPLPGDHFANQFIGDYVQKLEDFIASYPIDFPLKDGDDTAVISLADDIFRVSAECTRAGPNLLYYSTEFSKSDNGSVPQDTRGWFVDGCGYLLPPPEGGVGEPWTGCVAVTQEVLEPTTPIPDGGAPFGVTRNLLPGPNEEIPASAIPYRVRNQPCIVGLGADGEETECPDEPSYVSRGSLTQWLTNLGPGHYRASIYALLDLEAEYDALDGGQNHAELRVVRDGPVPETVAYVALTSLESTGWQRFHIPFEADGSSNYRLELLPSVDEQELELPGDAGTVSWPGLYVTAAQVERVGQDTDGTPTGPGVWVRTDSSRDVIDPACHEMKGPALRKRFERRCEYVCADGIKETCNVADSKTAIPVRCYYETDFAVTLEEIESGHLIPSGQIAIGNFNLRHNLAGINAVGTGLASCDGKPSSCYYNGFLEYTLIHSGNTYIRSYTGWNMPAKLDRAFIEHGKLLATERIITNPPSSTDLGLLEPYMKGEYKGRPVHGLYTLRIWDQPGLRWEQLEDLQLIWKYRYWTRFQK